MHVTENVWSSVRSLGRCAMRRTCASACCDDATSSAASVHFRQAQLPKAAGAVDQPLAAIDRADFKAYQLMRLSREIEVAERALCEICNAHRDEQDLGQHVQCAQPLGEQQHECSDDQSAHAVYQKQSCRNAHGRHSPCVRAPGRPSDDSEDATEFGRSCIPHLPWDGG